MTAKEYVLSKCPTARADVYHKRDGWQPSRKYRRWIVKCNCGFCHEAKTERSAWVNAKKYLKENESES